MKPTFPHQLSALRKAAKLTNNELALRADVPESLIAGLQSGKRRIGELQARRLGAALGLGGSELEQFVLYAIDTCSEKILKEAINYPAELLNLIARQLRKAGILTESIFGYQVDGDHYDQNVTFSLGNGRTAVLKTHLIHA